MRAFYSLLGILLIWSGQLSAQQNCVPITSVNSPQFITLPCGVTCTSFSITVPHIKQTTSYINQSIPYQPYAFTSPTGTELPVLYVDDRYSALQQLGFDFCFFGANYNSFVVGSNGLITFDAANASCSNAWGLDNGIPLPYAGGTICTTYPEYYPRASIMAAYSDLDPRASISPSTKKIEYRIEGTAPCRKLIVSYNDIRMYSSSSCPDLNTFQIVVHEGSGIVEIFTKNKTVCPNWNGGNSIMGMQNWDRDDFIAFPGRNCTQWTARDEGHRFLPFGGTSRYVRSELLVGGAVVAVGDTGSVSGGLLNINFNNFCPTDSFTQAIIRTEFSSCNLSQDPLYRYDTFTIIKSRGLNATATSNPANCASATGSIVVTVPPGVGAPPLLYSLNGGPTQTSNVFANLVAGNYTVIVTDQSGQCRQTLLVTVGTVTGILGGATATPTSCPTVNNGSITVTPTSGQAPYTYTINGGVPQNSNTFSNLAPGTYNLTFTDFNGCLGQTTATVTAGAALTATSTQVNPPCAGINSGSLTVTPVTGQAPYTFSLNGGASQNSGTFTGLGPGSYTITFTDFLGCSGTANVTLVPTTPIALTIARQNVNCFGENNGSISLSINGGTGPYSYSIDGGTNFSNTPVFNNLVAGTYPVRIRDFNNCLLDSPVTITQPALLVANATTVPATCNGNDGIITVTATGGTPAYTYSINNGQNYLNSNSFTDSIRSYPNIKVKDAQGCIGSTTAVIALNDTMRLELGPDTTICELSNLTLIPQTNAQTTIFNWGPDMDISSLTTQNPVVSPHGDIRYYVRARWGVCERTDTINVFVKLQPVANAGTDTTICYKTAAQLNGYVIRTSGPVSFLWLPSASVNPANNFTATAKPDTTQQYVLEVSDNYGCNFKVYDTVWVFMRAPVPADAGRDTIAATGIPHQLLGGGGIRYVWSPAAPLNNPFVQSPQATLFADTRFKVFVQDNAGCIGEDDVFVKVYDGPTYYLPNAFSPNGDGLNDVFRPTPVEIVSTQYFRVFNRYGKIIFETNQYRKGWDGRFEGKEQPQGTYVWMIRGIDKFGKIVEQKGTFLLIR
jgi:gliding motility-associated-like protein